MNFAFQALLAQDGDAQWIPPAAGARLQFA